MISYELNDVPIFRSNYLYNNHILGYCIVKVSYMTEMILYIKSHGKKYQLSIEKSFDKKNKEKVSDMNVKLKEVDKFKIPDEKESVIYEYHIFETKVNDIFRIKSINEMDELLQIRYFGKKDIKEKSKALVSENIFIALEENIYGIYDKCIKNTEKMPNSYEFAKKIMDFEELKEYVKSKK